MAEKARQVERPCPWCGKETLADIDSDTVHDAPDGGVDFECPACGEPVHADASRQKLTKGKRSDKPHGTGS